MALTEQHIEETLKTVIDQTTGKDYVSSKAVENIKIVDNHVSLDIALGYPAKTMLESIREQISAALKSIAGVNTVTVNVFSKIIPHSVQRGVKLIQALRISSRLLQARAVLGNQQRPLILHWHSLPKAPMLAFSMQTFMAHPNRKCWVSLVIESPDGKPLNP